MNYDIVIIGAGIAGLSNAFFLSNKGYKIALVDRRIDLLNLNFQTLGSFLDYKKYGFSDKVVASPIKECIFHSNHLKVHKKIFTENPVNILNKRQIHHELLEKIKQDKNINILSSTTIQEINASDGKVNYLTTSNNENISANIYIDCSGITGIISKEFGLMPVTESVCTGLEYNVKYLGDPQAAYLLYGNIYMGGYGWIFPLGNQRAIFGIGSFNNKVRSELKKRLDLVIEEQFSEIVVKDNDKLEGGTIPLTKPITQFIKGNVICIGDSVSNVNPLVGEGYRFIIESSELASGYIIESLKKNDLSILEKYNLEWKKKYLKNYIRAKKLQKVAELGSKVGFIGDFLIFILSTKRSKTITNLMKSDISKRDLFLP